MAISSTTYKKGHSGVKGAKNEMWKGDQASYAAIHIWLVTNYGKPTKCENLDCIYPRKNKHNDILLKPARFEYALVKGKKYSHNRDNFIVLCGSCHKRYDLNIVPVTISLPSTKKKSKKK